MANQGTTTIMACGDINIQRRDSPSQVFDSVRAHLQTAGVLLGNMEMALAGPEYTIEEKWGWPQSDPSMVQALVSVGFDGVSTGNNVTHGATAIMKSLSVLDEHGIASTGSGRNWAESRRPLLIEKPGVRLGMLGYSCIFFPRNHEATSDAPGIATVHCETAYQPHRRAAELPGAPPVVRSWPTSESMSTVASDIEALKEQAGIVVAYFHMGVSSQEELAEYQVHLAQGAIDAGADVVLGASAHRPQAIEMYQGKPIFYGLGNFAFDWPKVMHRRTGILAEMVVEGAQLTEVAFRPVYRPDTPVNAPEFVACDSTFGAPIVDRLVEMSAARGTSFANVEKDRVVVWRAG